MGRRRATVHNEAGAGLISTIVGVLAFLLLLLLATQTLVRLYTTSVVSATAFDAARRVATGADPADAEARARAALGSYGPRPTFAWTINGDDVELAVDGPAPVFLPSSFTVLGRIHRVVHVRRETFR